MTMITNIDNVSVALPATDSQTYNPDDCMILVAGHHGVYQWQYLVDQFEGHIYSEDDTVMLSQMLTDCADGPDGEFYHDCADYIRENCYMVFGGTVYRIDVSEGFNDIIAIPVTQWDSYCEALQNI